MNVNTNLNAALLCEHPGDLTPEALYDHIMSAITPELPYLARGGEQPTEILQTLDYGQRSAFCRWKKLSDIAEDFLNAEVIPLVNAGGSEGVYLDVSLNVRRYGRSDEEIPLFTFKTLNEDLVGAYMAMGALGGAVTYALELFAWLNGKTLEEEGGTR